MLCFIMFNSNTIKLTVHTSCYWVALPIIKLRKLFKDVTKSKVSFVGWQPLNQH